MSAKDKQISGDHYRKGGIQPIEYIHANEMDFMTGNIIKYATRWPYKGQALSDLRKVIHYAELLIEAEGLDTKCEAATSDEQIPLYSFSKNKWEDELTQPTEGSPCGFCDCEPGQCYDEMSDDAYEAWMNQMTHPDAKPVDVTTLPGYETR